MPSETVNKNPGGTYTAASSLAMMRLGSRPSSHPRYRPRISGWPWPALKRIRCPSGRNCGHRCVPCPAARRVSGAADPPMAAIRIRPTPVVSGAYTITPSRLHVPPRPAGASARICGLPPETPIRFSLPSAKKPIERPSGAQNGKLAPSVPVSDLGAAWSNGRTHSRDWPSSFATNANWRPSGDRANDTGSAVGGVTISTRISGNSGWVRHTYNSAGQTRAIAMRNETQAASRQARSRLRGAISGAPFRGGTDAVSSDSSANAKSSADLNRWAAPFARHRSTMRRWYSASDRRGP